MRLFVAVNLPATARHSAAQAAAPLLVADLPVNWVGEDGLHITLKFLGEVDESRAAPIGAALSTAVAQVRPFELGLGGFGAFPDLERPRVLWFGVERHPALELLANDVEKAVGPFGFAPELRPFQPHLTLGRARRDARPAAFRDLGDLARDVEWEVVVPVESVDLMESTLGAAGASYRIVHRAALGGKG
jgi:2'-5' RNA ligase